MNGDAEATAAQDAAAGTRTHTDPALTALQYGWGDAYEIGHDEERGHWARRRDGLGGDITAGDLDGLWTAIHEDYDLKPVPRDLPAAGQL